MVCFFFLKDAKANILNKDASNGLLRSNRRLKKNKVASSITKHKTQQTHLVPSVTSSLIRASFHFLSEDQDWSEPESCKKCEDCRLPGHSSGVYFNLFTENTDHVQSRFQMGCELFSPQALDCLWLLFYFFLLAKSHTFSLLFWFTIVKENSISSIYSVPGHAGAGARRAQCPSPLLPGHELGGGMAGEVSAFLRMQLGRVHTFGDN